MLHLGRDEQETQLPFSSSQSFGDESGKHPGNPSDLKFSAENQVLPDLQGCHLKTSFEPQSPASTWAAGPSHLRCSEASKLQEKGPREHKEDGPVFSAQWDVRVCLPGAGPLPGVQEEPVWGTHA